MEFRTTRLPTMRLPSRRMMHPRGCGVPRCSRRSCGSTRPGGCPVRRCRSSCCARSGCCGTRTALSRRRCQDRRSVGRAPPHAATGGVDQEDAAEDVLGRGEVAQGVPSHPEGYAEREPADIAALDPDTVVAIVGDPDIAELVLRARVHQRVVAVDRVAVQIEGDVVGPDAMPLFGQSSRSLSSVVSTVIVSPLSGPASAAWPPTSASSAETEDVAASKTRVTRWPEAEALASCPPQPATVSRLCLHRSGIRTSADRAGWPLSTKPTSVAGTTIA